MDKGVEKATYVQGKNVGPHFENPNSYAEAILQQQPHIEKLMKDLCAQLAKCDLSLSDHKISVYNIFMEALEAVVAAHQALGNEADIKWIEFVEDLEDQDLEG
eukprot:10516747-Ditylum_brightwellii.AAC.1